MKHSYLIIDLDVIIGEVTESRVYWKPSLFSSLSRIVSYGLFTPSYGSVKGQQ